jgi:septal ring factor EnvC (AmiA/AmiB activator)
MTVIGAVLGGVGGELSLTYLLRFRAKRSKSRLRQGAFLFFVSLFLAHAAAVPWVWGKDDPAQLGESITRGKSELKRLEDEIRGKKKEKMALKKEEESVLSTLEKMDHRIRSLQSDTVSIEARIQKKEVEIGYLSTAMDQLYESIDERKDLIGKRVQTLYREGSGGFLKRLVPSPDYPTFLKRLHYLRTVARKEMEILAFLEEEQFQLETKNAQLGKVKQQLISQQVLHLLNLVVSTREPLRAKLSEIEKEKYKKNVVLARVRDEKAFYDKTIVELDESSSQLKGLIKKLEEERRKAKEKEPQLPLTHFLKDKGRLNWPNDGVVASLFGRQKHPRFNTYIFRKGIEIDTSKVEDVRAVYDGVVVHADWFKGYGMMVILDHGENYYSVYAYLAKLLVSVGDKVTKNRTIGVVGDTGVSEGKRLYFELRHQGEPMDPLAWLEKRG